MIRIRSQLSTIQKSDAMITMYSTKLKSLADEIMTTEKKLDGDDVMSYILVGLDAEYNLFDSLISSKENIFLSHDLYANAALRGNFGRYYGRYYGRCTGRGSGHGRGDGSRHILVMLQRSPHHSFIIEVIQSLLHWR
uniref:Uncharacterized protein n=1 Tax=Kalanchoe fedtschenkoi TaxID=63787 RepID=A0A7N0UKZ2_KALFE